ncbi:MAG: uncharacterized protein QOC99_1691 [Acidobacteriota bacterium]|nr:uncharacterized protein [Acidobacteriota bacterium]
MSYSPRIAKTKRLRCRKVAASVTAFVMLTLLLVAPRLPAAHAQQAAVPSIHISQIYTRGGESGALYQNDFIELFNGGNSTVDINGWTLAVTTTEGSSTSYSVVNFVSSRGIGIEPGRHLLIELAGGTEGQPLPSPDLSVPPMHLGSTSGQVALLNKNQVIDFGRCFAKDTTGTVEDFVGYGTTSCYEGSGPVPAPTLANAILRQSGGCKDTDDNVADFQYAAPNPRNTSNAASPCGAQAVQSIIDVGAPQFDAYEGQGHIDITFTRMGDLSTAVYAEYLVAGGTASERSDFTTAAGYVHFAPGEREKTIPVLITDDAFEEPSESTGVAILNPSPGASIGVRNQALLVIHDNDSGPSASNPIDESSFYVRQHYADFLSRDSDMSGLSFWSSGLDACGTNAQCREVKRIDTSAAFFLSIEFQETGYLVYRLYKASLPENRARPRALPRYREFVRDTQEVSRGIIVGETGWEQKLADNTNAFLEMFVARPEFTLIYPAQLSPAAYVDKLNAQAGGPLSPAERDALVSGMLSGQETRATVLRHVADDEDFRRAEFNRAFVLMQYFGYLRRNPDDAPDANFDGYDFWLSKLNQFGGDYRRAEMVKAFIASPEYRARFAAPAP